MDTRDLIAFINNHHIEANIVYLDDDTLTVESAAAALDVSPNHIAKSILFVAGGEPHLVIASGTTRISYKQLAKHLNLSRKRVKLANAEQVMEFTGYPVGTVPPFGHKVLLTTLIEKQILGQNEIYAGGGAPNALIRVTVEELIRVTKASLLTLQSE